MLNYKKGGNYMKKTKIIKKEVYFIND